MGFVTCGFTNSKYNCFIQWILMCFDGWSFILAFCAYIFLWFYFYVGKMELDMQYFSVIGATTHLCVFVFLVILDFLFKSDMMFMIGQSESTSGGMTTITTVGLMETNPIIQPEIEEENCFQQNPCALYRKHYIVTGFKIIFVILDILVLSFFNNGWKCANLTKC